MSAPVLILSTGLSKDTAANRALPEFRKATPNMILAQTSVVQALEPMAKIVAQIGLQHCGFILGSSHGELSVTVNFLKTLIQDHVARPLLFQNSLHNSTGGFVAMSQHITGPMATVSNRYFTGEDAIDTGLLLLQQRQCKMCLVTSVDAQVSDIVDGVNVLPPIYGQGAGTVLLARADCEAELAAATLDLQPLGELQSVTYERVSAQNPIPPPLGFYESNAIELWVEALRTPLLQESTAPLRLSKPDGTASVIQWRRT